MVGRNEVCQQATAKKNLFTADAIRNLQMLHDGALLTFMADPSKLNFTNVFCPQSSNFIRKMKCHEIKENFLKA